MSQEETPTTAILPLQESTPVDATGLVGTYADDLIAGLFEDVDKILEGDEAALAAVTATESFVALETPASDDQSSLEPTLESLNSLVPVPKDSDLDLFTPSITPLAPTPVPPKQSKTSLGKLFDRLLLATTALSLLGAAAFIWFNQQPRYATDGLGNGQTATGTTESEFLNYLQRSLDVIASKADAQNTTSQASVAPGTAALGGPPLLPPLASGAGGGGMASGSPLNVIERVYIPYQTAQNPMAAAPRGTAPPVVSLTPTQPTAPPAQPAAPAAVHVLVGVLELGDRSAALFEINGVSQRVYIGERVGSSDWNLVSVSNEEAVIRRNGEVRSVYIGQQF